jgi:hypothetical protein
MIRRITAIVSAFALALAVPFFPIQKAEAAVTVMCAPEGVAQAINRTVGAGISGTGSVSPVPSGTTYTLNGQGCTIVKQADVGYFLSQGFSAGPPFGANILFTTGVATGTTSFQLGNLPPATYIQHIIVNNTTANAVTGGIAFGTTSGGTDIVTALTCGANCLAFTLDSALSKRVFSTSASQAIFATAVTAWNNANVTITVVYGYF